MRSAPLDGVLAVHVAQRVRDEALGIDRVIEAPGSAEAHDVPVVLQLDRVAGHVRDDHGRCAVIVQHRLAVVHEHAAAVDPVCMVDTAAVAPVAPDHVAAVDAPCDPARDPLSRDVRLRAAGEHFCAPVRHDQRTATAMLDAGHHETPARRAVDARERLRDVQAVRPGQLRAPERAWRHHVKETGVVQRAVRAVRHVAHALGLVRFRGDHVTDIVHAIDQVRIAG